jgi:hypothetical protein
MVKRLLGLIGLGGGTNSTSLSAMRFSFVWPIERRVLPPILF